MWLSDPVEQWQRDSRRYHTSGLSAIYAIRHIPTNRHYVGSAVNVYGRWKMHRSNLNRGIHPNQYLQNAWNKYGPNEFEWLLLESVPDQAQLVSIEQRWIDALRATDRDFGFNICPKAGSSCGRKASAETRRKQSLALMGNKHTLGQRLTEEHKRRIGQKSRGHPVSQEQRDATAEAISLVWEVTFPDGRVVTVKNLRRFCREHSVSVATMFQIATGFIKRNRAGWKCRRISPPRNSQENES